MPTRICVLTTTVLVLVSSLMASARVSAGPLAFLCGHAKHAHHTHPHHTHPHKHTPFVFVTPNGALSSSPIYNYSVLAVPAAAFQQCTAPTMVYPASQGMPPFSVHLPSGGPYGGNMCPQHHPCHGHPHGCWPGR